MIHICYGMRDSSGHYSKFVGTSMLSMFENTREKITVHILHDSTLTDDNRNKLEQIVSMYQQQIRFYNVDELVPESVDAINAKIDSIKQHPATVAAFYRILIPDVLPKNISRAVYLDGDMIINLDIKELWNFDLGRFSIGAVPEYFSGIDLDKNIFLLREKIVDSRDYFNSGMLLMDLNRARITGGGDAS